MKQYNHIDEENSLDSEVSESWGGSWTTEKLDAFESYVKDGYLKIMNNNRDKYSFKLIYLDAFAGSGSRVNSDTPKDSNSLLSIFPMDQLPEDESNVYQGAAERVLKVEQNESIRGFDYYYFVDKDQQSLEKLKLKLSKYKVYGKISYKNDDANIEVLKMADAMRKDGHLKSLTLLDPFGMQIDWTTIAALKGLSVDLFVLIPTGVIINRLLGKKGEIMYPEKLTRTLGLSLDEIYRIFYHHETFTDLFGDEYDIVNKVKHPCELIAKEYIKKLKGIFNFVTEKPLVLYNSKNVPIYHFVFASQNAAAKRVAQYIVDKKNHHGYKN